MSVEFRNYDESSCDSWLSTCNRFSLLLVEVVADTYVYRMWDSATDVTTEHVALGSATAYAASIMRSYVIGSDDVNRRGF